MGRRSDRSDGRAWRLYVDETGRFDDSDTSAVVGLLLRCSDHHALDRELRAWLSERVPEVRWPLHANELVHETQLVTAYASLPEGQRSRSPVAGALEAAWQRMKQSADPDVQSLVQPSRDARRDEMAAHLAATIELRRTNCKDAARLRVRLEEISSLLRQTLQDLVQALGDDSVYVVAAVAPRSSALAPTRADPYLETLRGLFERTLAVLRARPRRRESVRALVARRDVTSPDVGRHSLHVTDVQRAARAARSTFPDGESAEQPCESTFLNPELPVDYRNNPEAGLVLADFLAHRLGRVLRDPSVDWPQLSAQMWRITGLRPLAVPRIAPDAGPIPTIALPDPWNARLMDIARGEVGRPVPSMPRWGVEATTAMAAWIGALK
jgi:hypothetical protein